MVSLYIAAGVYPEESETVSFGLIGAKVYFHPASLGFADTRFYILKADFFAVILGPRMRENRVRRNVSGIKFSANELAVRFALQEAHCETLNGGCCGRLLGKLTTVRWRTIRGLTKSKGYRDDHKSRYTQYN
jgi:hypothetical protein